MNAKLSNEQISALKQVIGGADVFGYSLAKSLREIEKIAPELIYICDRQGDYKGYEQLPYFGAIVTKSGIEYLKNIKEI
jgi:hypothetical protein